MHEIHNFDKNSSQETRKMLFRGFGNAPSDFPWLASHFQSVVLDSFKFSEKLGRGWKMCSSKSICAVLKQQMHGEQANKNITVKCVCRLSCEFSRKCYLFSNLGKIHEKCKE
jgi:hypothetical protein